MYGFKDCFQQAQGGWIRRLFACLPSVIDFRWREADFRFNRSYGGLLGRIGLDGHAPLALLLPALFLVFLVYGPTLGWRGPGAAVLLIAGWGGLYAAARLLPPRLRFDVELLVLALWAGLVWFCASPEALENQPKLYRHLLIPLYLFLVALPLIGLRFTVRALFRHMPKKPNFGDLLPHVNLFAKPPVPPEVDGFTIFRSLVVVPLQYPLHLLFVPALVVLLLPYYLAVQWWALGLLLVWWVLLSSFTHHRLGNALHLMRRALFIGGQLVVSLVVIILGAGRVAEVSYIQTVVESSRWSTLLSYLLSAYVAFWFFEYWLNRLLLEEMMGLLRRPGEPRGKTEYSLDPGETFATSVEPAGRAVQIHGGARLISIGKLEDSKREAFEPFEKHELFEELLRRAAWSPVASALAHREDWWEKLAQIQRGARFYFSFANLVLLLLAVGAGVALTLGTQVAALQVPVGQPAGTGGGEAAPFHLAEHIWGSGQERDKVILVAASGGGTRAALYTESLLRGLGELGALEDVVLASGVSGGGTALAYFGSRRHDLIGSPDGEVWDQFACDLSQPFIQDVLEGSAEWRIVAGTRSGKLLQESFGRAFYPPRRKSDTRVLGGVGLGLIFNTSLAGHLEVPRAYEGTDFAHAARKLRKRTDGSVGGGRLIFTNLSPDDAFSEKRTDRNLQYVVITDPKVPLTAAAALHANFPPVFSNAPVDRLHPGAGCIWGDRYWVTDGGTVENRGLISLLLALRGALLEEEQEADPPAALPEIHILVAEASADSRKYNQDRGVGTKFGASEKVANQLIGELLDDVARRYGTMCTDGGQRCGKVFYHDLAMPKFLRIDSGLGTHWMLPRTVKMTAPDGKSIMTLDSFEARHVINALHHTGSDDEVHLCPGEGVGLAGRVLDRLGESLGRPSRAERLKTVLDWAEDENSRHRQAWDGFRGCYAGNRPCPPSSQLRPQ